MINVEFTNEINDIVTENLYQWDNYQTLKISGINFGSVTPRVHFANKKSKEALVVNGSLQSDGSFEVSIPNSLLTEKYDILAYVYTNTGLTNKTIKSITIPIIARLKPSEYYQPSDEDIAQIEAIELEAKAIIDGLTASEYDENETYKRPNIVYYNQCAYMCKSNVEITGVLPTDTSKWQEIMHGEHIQGVNVGGDGKLNFITSSGTSYSIDFQTEEVNLVDSTDIPALALTSDDVTKVKTSKVFELSEDNVNKCKNLVALKPIEQGLAYGEYSPSSTGLFSIIVKEIETNQLFQILMSIEKLFNQVYYSQGVMSLSSNLWCYVKYTKVNPDNDRWGFTLVKSNDTSATHVQIVSVNQLMEY